MILAPGIHYRIRTSSGIPSAVVLLAWQSVVVPLGGFGWRGDFGWAVQALGQGVLLLAPLFIAFSAAGPALRGGVQTSDDLMPIAPGRTLLRRWTFDLVPPLAVQVLALTIALGWCLMLGGSLEPSVLLIVAIQLCALALFCALGLMIGYVWRNPTAVALAAVVGLALVAYGSHVLRVGGGRIPFTGLAPDPGGFLLSLGIEVAGVVLLVGLLAAHRSPQALFVTPWVVTVMILVAAVLMPGPTWSPTGARPQVCSTRTGIEVCVFAGYGRMLPATESTLDRFETVFAREKIDPGITMIGQVVPGNPPERRGVGRIMFPTTELDEAAVSDETVLDALARPVWCRRLFEGDSPPVANPERDVFVQAWLLHEVGAIGDVTFHGMAGALSDRSDTQQVDVVRDYFADNLDCRGLG